MLRRWIGLLFAAAAGGASLWAYPRLPATVPSHWNIHGVVDQYTGRGRAALLLPGIILGMWLVFQVLPRIDPRGRNYEKFPDTYWTLVSGVLGFLLVVHLGLLANAIGAPVSFPRVVTVAGGLLFVVVGNYLGRIESNWFLGLRTPWTLSSDVVWRKTHRTAGWLFVGAGLIVAGIGAVQTVPFTRVLAVTAAVVVVIPLVQSFILWKREQRS